MGQRRKEGMLRPEDNPPEKKGSVDFTILDVSDYEPPRVPSKTWRELIKKVWEIDPLIGINPPLIPVSVQIAKSDFLLAGLIAIRKSATVFPASQFIHHAFGIKCHNHTDKDAYG